MPRALTLEEKIERSRAAAAERVAQRNAEMNGQSLEPSIAIDGTRRKRRNAFNGTEGKLSVRGEIPGYHLHILTDSGARIQEALDSGYEFVNPSEIEGVSENVVSRNGDLGDRVRFLVNARASGSEQYGYLMKIRQEWYEEDQAALQERNSRIDASIRKGTVAGANPNFYVPQGGISIKQS